MLFVFAVSAVNAQNMQNTKHYRSHFVYQTGLAFNAGVGDLRFENRNLPNRLPNFCVDQIIAYQFNPYFTLGVDLGLNIWKKRKNQEVCQIFADFPPKNNRYFSYAL